MLATFNFKGWRPTPEVIFMKIKYNMTATENNDVEMHLDIEMSERLVKLITYVGDKLIKGKSCNAQEFFDYLRENPLR